MKEGLFRTFYKWRGWIEAGHSNQTCVMTCNMSPCQPPLTGHLPLARVQVSPAWPGPSSSDGEQGPMGPVVRHQHVGSNQKSAGYCHMMSGKISPVIQSFQSKLRLFESLKTHRDRELSRSCNLVTGSFSSRRIHLVSRSFLRYLAEVRVLSARGQCVTNVTPVITETPERERAWQWQVRQLCDNTGLSSAIWFRGN